MWVRMPSKTGEKSSCEARETSTSACETGETGDKCSHANEGMWGHDFDESQALFGRAVAGWFGAKLPAKRGRKEALSSKRDDKSACLRKRDGA